MSLDTGTSTSVSKTLIPQWDGTMGTYALYREQFGAVAVFSNCPDVLDEGEMFHMPTKLEYTSIKGRDTTNNAHSTDEVKKMSLWDQNTKMSSVYTLGQLTNAGVKVLVETKSADFPHGKVWRAFKTLDKKFKPKDATAKIELQMELEALQFTKASDFYNQVVEVCAKYENDLDEETKLTTLLKKTNNTVYVQIITRELTSSSPSFETACDEISVLQRGVKAGQKTEPKKPGGKEVTLNDIEKGDKASKDKCPHCQGKHARKDCPKRKEALKKQGACPECGKENHLEKECWKKNPSKAPKWWNREGKSSETSNANVELVVPSIELRQDFA
jgi:transcription elongation factor Elf1